MRDVEARRAMEAAARRLVVEQYDWSAVANDFEDALLRAARPAQRARAIA
jgi:glycosyltransferase involved in cell wall biosynthesis